MSNFEFDSIGRDIEKGAKGSSGYPIGTVRTHGGKRMVKTAKGWVPQPQSKDTTTKTKSEPKKVSPAATIKKVFAEADFHPEEMDDEDFLSQMAIEDAIGIVEMEEMDGNISASEASAMIRKLNNHK